MVLDYKEHSATYWQIAPGRNAMWWNDLLSNSIIAVGFANIDKDLTGISKNEFMKIFKEAYPDWTERRTQIKSGQLWNFINLKPGDKFVTNKGQRTILALGVVKSNYKFRPENPEYKHTIDVEYYKISESGITITDELKYKFGKTIIPKKKKIS